mmetsp:Transcript_14517/g.54847  ORF Transcript_14517/g.54847 Transcript_14517/m.54847 type:complete len:213 (+) Transcript_14517:216-854(+)
MHNGSSMLRVHTHGFFSNRKLSLSCWAGALRPHGQALLVGHRLRHLAGRQRRLQDVHSRDAIGLEDDDELLLRVITIDAAHDLLHVRPLRVEHQRVAQPGNGHELLDAALRRGRLGARLLGDVHGASAQAAVALPGRATGAEAGLGDEAVVRMLPVALGAKHAEGVHARRGSDLRERARMRHEQRCDHQTRNPERIRHLFARAWASNSAEFC